MYETFYNKNKSNNQNNNFKLSRSNRKKKSINH